MLRYALIYGGLSGAIVIAVISITLMTMGPESAASSQMSGYAIMIVALSLVFIGVKRYRDVEQGGVISFKTGASVGVTMAAIAGIVYTIGWEAVLFATDFAFIETYSQTMIDSIKAQGLSPSEEAAKIAEIRSGMDMYRNPMFRLPITFVEIFPVGLIVALVSALILKNPKVLPVRAAV
ncbi:MAG: DUF4199 domain-containing protein [Pseudomonadota bacterium]